VLWTLISSTFEDACSAYIQSSRLIKQLDVPYIVYIAQAILKNIYIFLHNAIIIPFLFIIFGKELDLSIFLAIPGLILLIVNLAWVSIILGAACARFRDLQQIIRSLLQVMFYLTPVIWMPTQVPDRFNNILLNCNPVFHLLEIVRSPILGQNPTALNWYVTIALAVFGWLVTIAFFGKTSRRIVFWI
jgi:ABC-type polysaccharide/polyol phosphate export permease